ncbi:MAG TPA: hypothetical protein VGR90_04555 [Acidimicrobiales bacterium]|nr:hypothetical protein [Acidimicrobiales bacterium]
MARAKCGCRVEIETGEIHVYPCENEDHEKALVWAAVDLARRGEVVVVDHR